LDQIATIVGGTLNEAADPHTVVNGTVEFDSRKVTPGGLFYVSQGHESMGMILLRQLLLMGQWQ